MGQAGKNLNNGPRKSIRAKPETRPRHKIMLKHDVMLSYMFKVMLTEDDSTVYCLKFR
jgi:hypothetical protein